MDTPENPMNHLPYNQSPLPFLILRDLRDDQPTFAVLASEDALYRNDRGELLLPVFPGTPWPDSNTSPPLGYALDTIRKHCSIVVTGADDVWSAITGRYPNAVRLTPEAARLSGALPRNGWLFPPRLAHLALEADNIHVNTRCGLTIPFESAKFAGDADDDSGQAEFLVHDRVIATFDPNRANCPVCAATWQIPLFPPAS